MSPFKTVNMRYTNKIKIGFLSYQFVELGPSCTVPLASVALMYQPLICIFMDQRPIHTFCIASPVRTCCFPIRAFRFMVPTLMQ